MTIPLEVFDNSSFHEILKSVGYGSLAYWVVEPWIGRRAMLVLHVTEGV